MDTNLPSDADQVAPQLGQGTGPKALAAPAKAGYAPNPYVKRYDWESVDWSLTPTQIANQLGCCTKAVKLRKRKLFGPSKLLTNTDEPTLDSDITRADKKWLTVDWTKSNQEISEEMRCSKSCVEKWRARFDPEVLCGTQGTEEELVSFFLPCPEPVSMPRWFLIRNPESALDAVLHRITNEPELRKLIEDDKFIKRQFLKRNRIAAQLNKNIRTTQIDSIAAAKRIIARSWDKRQELESQLRVASQNIVERCARLTSVARTEAANKMIQSQNEKYNGSLLDTVPR